VPVLTLIDLGPRPAAVIEAIAMLAEVGPRRAAELVERLPAYLVAPGTGAVLRDELERLGATVEDREPPPSPPVPAATPADAVAVRLLAPGPDTVRAVKAIRLATGLTLAEARRLVAAAPADIEVPPHAAAALRRELQAAGARVA
jgi:large subunit ribosomal protein L7/L12